MPKACIPLAVGVPKPADGTEIVIMGPTKFIDGLIK